MFFKYIPFEILYEILSFTKNNKTSYNLLFTCKELKNILYKYGYLKFLSYNVNIDPYNFSILTCKHERSLNQISIYNLNNPQHWIFYWPEKVFMNNCRIIDVIDPPAQVKTKYLTIINNRSGKELKINLKKFPNLIKIISN